MSSEDAKAACENERMSIPAPSLPVRASPQRLVLAAFLCLLIAAAALRFYDLPGNSLEYDEAVAANNSSGSLVEVVPNTRHSNTAPILYPLALWAVQKVESTPFSIRVLPAAASVLTVAVMLFLLPRLGVSRRAAFLAALLTTLSAAAIQQAQDAREYSIDALLAVLMIAGLLWYLRDGRKAPLCVSLFLAPLLQYGMVLFGAAVLGAAMLLLPPTLSASEGNSYPGRIRNWIEQRIALLWPAACFLAGGAISYAVTLRYQSPQGGWASDHYLSEYYYQGKFDALAIFEFSINGIWNLLTYHLPWVVAIAALAAFAILLGAAVLRKFQGKLQHNAITVLFSLCIAVSVAAALLSIYPLGDIRQAIYLGPVIFLAAAVALHWMAGSLTALTRRAWMAPALTIAAAGAIALAGVAAMRQDSPYESRYDTKPVLAFLEENVREEDMVYAGRAAAPTIQFHQGKPDNYYYGTHWCRDFAEPCLREMANLAYSLGIINSRIWFVTDNRLKLLENMPEPSVERLTGGKIPELYLITNSNEIIARAEEMTARIEEMMFQPETIIPIRSDFDVYLSENTLVYVREPCAPTDTEAKFFLHLHPVDVNALPDRRKKHGFDNLDFDFYSRGAISDGKCIANIPLPEYDIVTINTGQYVPVEGGYKNLWEGEIRIALIANVEAAVRSAEPVIRSTFDVHLSDNTLTYAKEPCDRADTEATFLLHLYPVDVNDLPDRRKKHGFDNLDFDFNSRGAISDRRCIANIPLPEYDIATISTGQYVPVEGGYNHLWEGEIRLAQ